MSDLRPEPIQITKRSGNKRKLLIAVALVVLLGGGGLGSVSYLNNQSKKLVVQQLQSMNDQAAANAKKSGGDAKLTYDVVEMQGGLIKNKAVVKAPKLEFTRSNMIGMEEKTVISTASAVVDVAGLKSDVVDLTLPDPVLVNVDGQDRFSLAFTDAPNIKISPTTVDGVNVVKREVHVPGALKLTSFKAGTNGEDKIMNVSYDAENTILANSSEDGTYEDVTLNLTNVKIESGDETMSMAVLALNSTDKPSGEGVQNFSLAFNVTDLAYKTAKREGGPFSVDVKANGEYSKDGKTMKTTVENVSLTSKDYGITLKGSMSNAEKDPLPSGEGNIHIRGLSALSASNLFAPYTETVMQVLEQINGAPIAELTDMEFAIKREPMGTVMIGQTTFEQLIGLIMTKAASAPVADPAASSSSSEKSSSSAPAETPEIPPAAPVEPVAPAPTAPVTPATPGQ